MSRPYQEHELSNGTRDVLRFFTYKHLPPHLQETSKMFHDLAWKLALQTPPSRELEKSLDRLLEAKDAAVRAKVQTPGFGALFVDYRKDNPA